MADTTWKEDPSLLPYERAEAFDGWFRGWFRDPSVPSARGGFEDPYSSTSAGSIVSCRECGALVLHDSKSDSGRVSNLNTHRSWHDKLAVFLSQEGK